MAKKKKFKKSRTNLHDWCVDYVKLYKVNQIKQSTLQSYLFSCEHIPDGLSVDVSARELQEIISSMHSKGLSNSTINHTMTIIRQALKKAYQLGMIKNVPSFDSVEFPRGNSNRIEAFTQNEIDRLGGVLIQPGRFNDIFLFLLLTGMRVGEALALRWSDVDFKRRCITIIRTNYRGQIQEPKTMNSIRTIPLTAEARFLLRKRSQRHGDDEFIFSYSYHSLLCAFKRLCGRAGVTPRGLHALRHTYATAALRSGVNVKTLSALLGHSSVSFTLDIYCSVELLDKQKEADKIRFFSTSTAPQKGLNVIQVFK